MAESKYTPKRVKRIIKAVKDGLPFFAGANVHIRVPFENHTAKHPHTARIITTYNRLQWQD